MIRLALLGGVLLAHGDGEPNAAWYQSLRQNAAPHASCCDAQDCQPTQSRVVDGQYQALVQGVWYPVPAAAVLHRENPTGEAVVCISQWLAPRQVLCFVPAPEV